MRFQLIWSLKHLKVFLGLFISLLLILSFQTSNLTAAKLYEENLFLKGTKFEDRNGDGFKNIEEPGIPGRVIRLIGNDTQASTTTDSLGQYSFSNLRPGNYTIFDENEDGWSQTAPGCRAYQVALTDKGASNLDFGRVQNSSNRYAYSGYDSKGYGYVFALMHPSRNDLRNWNELRQSLPMAEIISSSPLSYGADQTAAKSFSLLKYLTCCPAERNQGKCGNCWIWAGLGALEIDMAIRFGIQERLSIQYLNSYYWCCDGGQLTYFAKLLNMTRAAIPWSNANAHWHDGCGEDCNNKSCISVQAISTSSSYHILSARAEHVPTQNMGREKAIANIKNVLQHGKAVNFAFFMPTIEDISKFENFWSDKPESDVLKMDYSCGKSWSQNGSAGHVVLCIGYDDTDPNNRYWLMVNSWGAPLNRPNGLFKVSMDMDYDCFVLTPDGPYPIFDWEVLKVQYPDNMYEIEPKELKGSKESGQEVSKQLYRPLGSLDNLNLLPQRRSYGS